MNPLILAITVTGLLMSCGCVSERRARTREAIARHAGYEEMRETCGLYVVEAKHVYDAEVCRLLDKEHSSDFNDMADAAAARANCDLDGHP